MNNQAKIMFASFICFAVYIETRKKEMPNNLKKFFRKLAKITKLYEKNLSIVNDELNQILKNVEGDSVDLLLLSVTIVSEYYLQTRGKKTLFYPMSWDEIRDLQDECLEKVDSNTSDTTFDVAELIVKEML